MPNYKNDPTEEFDIIEIDELEEAIRDSRRHQKEKLKALSKINYATEKLSYLLSVMKDSELSLHRKTVNEILDKFKQVNP